MEEKTDPQKSEKMLKGIYGTIDSGLLSGSARELL